MTDMAEGHASAPHWPRTLHAGNVANVAYGYAKILARRGASVEVICHDVTHLMSQPEWDDLVLDPKDFPDENRFDINTADFGDYRRPPWFKSQTLGGGTPGLRSALVRLAARHLPSRIKRALEPLYYRMRRLRDLATRRSPAEASVDEKSAIRVAELTAIALQLGSDWRIDPNALAAYSRQGRWLVSHAGQADVVFCYALAAIYSLYCIDKPCVSVDIGTMRDIPFGRTGLARLLWLAYRLCDHVIITNPDTRRLAEAAGIRNYSFCPHPIDESTFYPADELVWRRQLQDQYGAETLLFAPARQNWRLKGNDRIFRGFALALKAGTKAVLLVPGWGQEVARSKALCRRLGIADRVVWLPPVPERLLARYYRAVDLVLDQLELGVFGLITPKAMACGAVVLTSYDEQHNAWCFPTPPPLVRCSSSEDVANAVVRTRGRRASAPRHRSGVPGLDRQPSLVRAGGGASRGGDAERDPAFCAAHAEAAVKILLLSHAFPPLSTIASHRAYGWARSWAAAGHEVHVLTPVKYSMEGPLDLDLPTDGLHVHTVAYGWRRPSGRATDAAGDGSIARWDLLRQRTRFLRNKLGPLGDVRMLVVPGLVRAGLHIVSGREFDVIVCAYGPSSSVIAASILGRKSNIPWVIDYQDLWSENYVQPRGALTRRISRFIERRVVRRATMLITVSHGLARRIEQALGRSALVAYFGYLEDDDDPPSSSLHPDQELALVYAGRVYEGHQTAERFVRCLANVLARRPGKDLLVDLYGPDQGGLARMVQARGVDAVVRLKGMVPQQRMLAIERQAAGLLFFDWTDPSAEGVLTGKLFEYLRNRRPIVFIGSGFETEASRLARRSGAAVILQTDEEIEEFLIHWPASVPAYSPDEEFISRLSCRRQAEIVISEVERRVRKGR